MTRETKTTGSAPLAEQVRAAVEALPGKRFTPAHLALLAGSLAGRSKMSTQRDDEAQTFVAWLLAHPDERGRIAGAPARDVVPFLRAAWKRCLGREKAATPGGKLQRALRDVLKADARSESPVFLSESGRIRCAVPLRSPRWPAKVLLDGEGDGLFDHARLARAAVAALRRGEGALTLSVLAARIAAQYGIGPDLPLLGAHEPRRSGSSTSSQVIRGLDVRRLLAQLDPQERAIIEARVGSEGWDALARRLGLPRATACDKYERALAKLRGLVGASYGRS